MMRIALLSLLFATPFVAGAEYQRKVVEPEIVRVEGVKLVDGIKTVTVSNNSGRYRLACNLAAHGCESPVANLDYYLINKDTYFKVPGAEDFMSLSFLQDWLVTYKNGENIGLVPTDPNSGHLGIYYLDSWSAKKR